EEMRGGHGMSVRRPRSGLLRRVLLVPVLVRRPGRAVETRGLEPLLAAIGTQPAGFERIPRVTASRIARPSRVLVRLPPALRTADARIVLVVLPGVDLKVALDESQHERRSEPDEMTHSDDDSISIIADSPFARITKPPSLCLPVVGHQSGDPGRLPDRFARQEFGEDRLDVHDRRPVRSVEPHDPDAARLARDQADDRRAEPVRPAPRPLREDADPRPAPI